MVVRKGRERLTISLDSRLADAVRNLAEKSGMSVSRVAAAAIAKMVDQHTSTPEAADAAWLEKVNGGGGEAERPEEG